MPADHQIEDEPRPEAKKEEGRQEVDSAAIFVIHQTSMASHGRRRSEANRKQLRGPSQPRASSAKRLSSVQGSCCKSCSGKTDREVRRVGVARRYVVIGLSRSEDGPRALPKRQK